MPLPNFFIIGAQKSGTTSLHHYLNQHPAIFMSAIKEPHYFIYSPATVNFNRKRLKQYLIQKTKEIKSLDKYMDLFSKVSTETAIGESSTGYLDDEGAFENIHKLIPGAKIIAMLRNPVDRALSHYKYHLMHGIETKPFTVALSKEKNRRKIYKEPLYGYFERGLYYQNLKKYYDLFDRDQIKIYLFEDFQYSPKDVLKDIFLFLGVDSNIDIDTSVRYNPTGIPKNQIIFNFLSTIAGMPLVNNLINKTLGNNKEKLRSVLLKPSSGEIISSVERETLINTYRDDIQKLEDLLGRDLSIWLK